MANPYSLVFGKEPSQFISRLKQTREILDNFTAETSPQQVYMITGVRGSGKTVMMSYISDTLNKKADWVTVELNSEDDLLKSLGAKLYNHISISKLFQSLRISLSAFGLSVELQKKEEIFDTEIAISQMLEVLKKHKKRVLITIDEVINSSSVRQFVSAYQIFVRQNAPVYLLMTGLYENISNLQDEKNLTFLYRAPKINLEPLNMGSISRNYKDTLNVDDSTSHEMAKLTCGYPYAFQVLGYLTYQNNGDYHSVLADYRQHLEEYVYEKIWSELSDMDKKIAYGIASCDSHKINDIRAILNIDTNHFNPYRKRLIRKGIINGSVHGHVTFTLPLFGEFVMENYIE